MAHLQNELYVLKCQLESTKNQDHIKNTLRSIICLDECIDETIRSLLQKYSVDSCKILRMVSIQQRFSMQCSLADYDIIFRFLMMANAIAIEENKTLIASLAVCDPLPFTKFFIDVDCVLCHKKEEPSTCQAGLIAANHFADAKKNGKRVINLLKQKVDKLFRHVPIDMVVATKSSAPFCGMHIYFQTNLDIVLKKLIFNELLTLNEELHTHSIDVTLNGILPLCRMYDRFFDNNLQPILPSYELCRKISYVDAWSQNKSHFYMKPIQDLEEFLSMQDYSDGPPSKRRKRTADDVFTLALMNGPVKESEVSYALSQGIHHNPEQSTSTYSYLTATYHFSKLKFLNSNSSTATITISDINQFMTPPSSTIADSVVSLSRIEEYYQQIIPLKHSNYHPIFTDNDSDLQDQPDEDHDTSMEIDLDFPDVFLNLKKNINPTCMEMPAEATVTDEYIGITEAEMVLLKKTLRESQYADNDLENILTEVFKSCSPYSVIYSAIGLGIDISQECCNCGNFTNSMDGGMAPARTVFDGDSAPQPVAPPPPRRGGGRGGRGRGRGKSAPKRDILSTVNIFSDEFLPITAELYDQFKDLVQNALLKNYTVALLSYFAKNCTKPVKSIIKVLLILLCGYRRPNSADSNIPWPSIQTHTALRKGIKVLIALLNYSDDFVENMLINSYSGCELFYAAWGFRLGTKPADMFITIHNKLRAAAIATKSDRFFEYLMTQILNCCTVGDKIMYFNGSHRVLCDEKEADVELAFLEGVGSFILPVAVNASVGCFSYYSSHGVFHPSINVFENPGPFLNMRVYRNYDNYFGQDKRFMYPTQSMYRFFKDIFFKARHFIRLMRTNTIGLMLLSPVTNVSVPVKFYHMHSSFKAVVPNVNILISDLTVAYNMAWPSELLTELKALTSVRTPFGVLWNNFLSLMITLNATNYIRSDPMHFILSMFGHSENQYQGIGKTQNLSGNRIKFHETTNPAADTATSDPTTENMDVENEKLPELNAEGTNPIFFQRIQNLLSKRRATWSNVIYPSFDNLSSLGSLSLIKKYTDEPHKKKLNQSLFAEYMNFGTFDFDLPEEIDFEAMPSDFLKLCIIIFSWLIRMGDVHRYRDCALMQKIAKYRMEVYTCFNNCILKYFHIGYIHGQPEDHARIFQEYCESVTLNYSTLLIEDANEVPPFLPIGREDLAFKGDQLNLTPTEKSNIYMAFSYLILFANYDHDTFIELTKLIASLEYGGNYLKKMYMFFGKSNGGKNIFVNNLQKTFYSTDKIRLNIKHYMDTSADFNPNSKIIGTNFLCNLDEPPAIMRPSEMKLDVNIGTVSNREIFGRGIEDYLIVAKMIITCNDCVGPSIPDAGWFKRLSLFQVDHTFCDLKENIHRTSAQSSGQLFNECTKYLISQIMTSCYPNHDTNSPGLIKGMVQISHVLLKRLYYYRESMPTSQAMTDKSRGLLFTYMMSYSPFFSFLNTCIIVPDVLQPKTSKEVMDFVRNWCSNHKKSFKSIQEAVRAHLQPFCQGNMYYVRLEERSFN